MKHSNTCVVCFDGKIVRGIYGKVLSSTQYKFTVEFTYYGETQVQTFRKDTRTHKRFTYGVNSGIFVVIPTNQLKSWYPTYVDIIENNTVEHMSKEVWE